MSKVLDTLIFVRKELSLLVLTDQQADEMLTRLTSYCKEYSLSVSDVELRKCIQHLDLVLETNKTTNLTRILNVEDAAVLHILDSLVLLPYINKAPEGALLDMGTGDDQPWRRRKDRYRGCLQNGACQDRKSTRLNSSHTDLSRMPSSA